MITREREFGQEALGCKGLRMHPHRQSWHPTQEASIFCPQLPSQFFFEEDSVRKLHLMVLAALTVAGTSPAFAQRSHPGGGPPSAAGNHGSSTGAENGNATSTAAAGNHSTSTGAANGNATSTAHANSMSAAPSDVLSHNPVIAGKIKTLTKEDASTACSGFKTIGQCVAAAHVAQNLSIPGGFDALRSAMTSGSGMSLGNAIQSLAPSADAKSESKKANKQAKEDIKTSAS
jgi:hypothetical protein